LKQLRRQSDLLAHLLDRSLEEILRQAMQHRNDDEWREKFEDYRGRSVLFDDRLRADASGRTILGSYVVRVGDVEARLALEDLLLLKQKPLPLDPPPRWLFGARLASCQREAGGVWVFRFEPDSAVLLTDEDAAAAWRGAFLARGSLPGPGRSAAFLEVACPSPDAAMALGGAWPPRRPIGACGRHRPAHALCLHGGCRRRPRRKHPAGSPRSAS